MEDDMKRLSFLRQNVRLTFLNLLLLTTVTSVVACGHIEDPQYVGEPLWVLNGRLTQSDEGADFEAVSLRVAFIWEQDIQENGAALISQDVPVVPEFPARFTLELYDPPPESTMHDGAELEEELAAYDFRIAVGQILVYDDLNGNGQLDILHADAQAYVDRVLGHAEDYWVVFVEGTPPTDPFENIVFEQGLNLIHFEENPDSFEDRVQQLDLSMEFDIAVGQYPELQYLMCNQPVERYESGGSNAPSAGSGEYPTDGSEGGSSTGTSDGTEPSDGDTIEPIDDTFDLSTIPEGANVECSPDGSFFSYEVTTTEQEAGICSPIYEMSMVGMVMWNPEWGDYPDDWPCDVTE